MDIAKNTMSCKSAFLLCPMLYDISYRILTKKLNFLTAAGIRNCRNRNPYTLKLIICLWDAQSISAGQYADRSFYKLL